MFIKKVPKRRGSKTYIHYKLVESYRSETGPKHRDLLHLGNLGCLEKEQIKLLAKRIESIIEGRKKTFFPIVDQEVELWAVHFSQKLIHKGLLNWPISEKAEEKPEYEEIDINSIGQSCTRTIGAEYVGVSTLKMLEFDKLFGQLGFNQSQIDQAILSIVARLVNPGSELSTSEWARNISGIDELLGTDFSDLSHNALYRISDLLYENKEEIENHLNNRERNLFSLKEQIILYDLSNTYFEGNAGENVKARRSRSKDKRNDRPLLTLGMVLDEMGFIKNSRIYPGNVSETKTLLEMIEDLRSWSDGSDGSDELIEITELSNKENCQKVKEKEKEKIIVVVDAGISSEENLGLLKANGYDYICVAKNKIEKPDVADDQLLKVRRKKDKKVEVKLIRRCDEQILYCRSDFKLNKERAIMDFFRNRFEEGLKSINASLHKKGGVKKYDKVLERIGRLKERNFSVAHYYQIDIKHKDEIVKSVEWEFEKEKEALDRFSGSYFLRTSRMDLDEKEIWSTYNMLTDIENAFRCLKTELGLRPIHHRKELRSDAHLFISVLAYHLLHTIRVMLRKKGIHMEWRFIRKLLSTQVRITTSMTTKDKGKIYIRDSSEPEKFHLMIYNALGLRRKPCGVRRVKGRICSPPN